MCKEEEDKISLQNKMDRIKQFMGEGNYNKVSSLELIHRVMDYFITCCLPEEEQRDQPIHEDIEQPPFY